MHIPTITHHYAVAALWSSIDMEGTPLDDVADVLDISEETFGAMLSDCTDFATSNARLLRASGQSDEQIGHDFWLTRNRHGVGFWDRGLGAVGEKLTQAAQVYGAVDLYIGDDGKVHA